MNAPPSLTPRLRLYMTWTCPYCKRVLDAIAKLDLQVELIDISAVEEASVDLQQRLGRAVVPVLRIEVDQWVRESSVIVHRLRAMAGSPSPVPAWVVLGLERLAPVAFGCLAAGLLSSSDVWRPALVTAGAVILALRLAARKL